MGKYVIVINKLLTSLNVIKIVPLFEERARNLNELDPLWRKVKRKSYVNFKIPEILTFFVNSNDHNLNLTIENFSRIIAVW